MFLASVFFFCETMMIELIGAALALAGAVLLILQEGGRK
jgi:ABC-type cobalamin transport system permease subunit